jgi:hypothetical protein
MPRREDDFAPRPDATSTRTLTLVGGFALAVAATLAVFLTDNPQYLKLAVVAVAWAFVIATFAAGRRSTDRVAAAARERELRRAYEVELEREVAARHEYELELENELRRETEDSVRYELDALRSDIAALSGLRDEVARVSDLRGDIAALTSLREEVARVAALRDDVAALNALRQDLGQLAELRTDVSRLRAELTEQLSSEMLVERIVMRTQASRIPADQGRSEAAGRILDGTQDWVDDVPPSELTGGWPAVRLDEPQETAHFEQIRVERTGPRPPVPAPTPAMRPWDAPLPTPPWELPPTTSWPAALEPEDEPSAGPQLWSSVGRHEGGASASRHSAREAPAVPPTSAFSMSPPPSTPVSAPPVELPPSPLDWSAERSRAEPSTPPSVRPVPYRRRSDDPLAPDPVDPAAAPTLQRPAVPPAKPTVRIDDRGGYRVAVREDPEPEPATQGTRVAEILAENGVSPSTGGRRRRRYRDEDESDDVLARVLRGN